MAMIDRSFVDGIFWRMLVLGAVTALILAVVIDLRFGYSLALGALVGALSLRVTTAAVVRMIRGALEEKRRSALWAVAPTLKLVVLFFVVFVVLVKLNAHAIAFALGVKMIFPALAWQAYRNPGHFMPDDADDTESS